MNIVDATIIHCQLIITGGAGHVNTGIGPSAVYNIVLLSCLRPGMGSRNSRDQLAHQVEVEFMFPIRRICSLLGEKDKTRHSCLTIGLCETESEPDWDREISARPLEFEKLSQI